MARMAIGNGGANLLQRLLIIIPLLHLRGNVLFLSLAWESGIRGLQRGVVS